MRNFVQQFLENALNLCRFYDYRRTPIYSLFLFCFIFLLSLLHLDGLNIFKIELWMFILRVERELKDASLNSNLRVIKLREL